MKGEGADRMIWNIFPREQTEAKTVWKSIEERTGAGKGDLMIVRASNEEIGPATRLNPGDRLRVIHRSQFTAGQESGSVDEGWASISIGKFTKRDHVLVIDRLLRNAKRIAGPGGCTIRKGEDLWDGSPVRREEFIVR
jgi:hypothetical protein